MSWFLLDSMQRRSDFSENNLDGSLRDSAEMHDAAVKEQEI